MESFPNKFLSPTWIMRTAALTSASNFRFLKNALRFLRSTSGDAVEDVSLSLFEYFGSLRKSDYERKSSMEIPEERD